MTSEPAHAEVAVIGGGPGGLDCALACAARGLAVTLIEQADLGGVCLNRGCIPTKLFLAATAPLRELRAQARYRVYTLPEDLPAALGVDVNALQERKERLVAGMRQAAAKRLADAGVRLVKGRACFTGPQALEAATPDGPLAIRFEWAIAATGSRAFHPPGFEPDNDRVLGSTQALALRRIPPSLLVLGGGAVGLEMAGFFHALGCRVSVVEARDRLAPAEDPEVGQVIAQTLRREKFGVHLGSPARELVRGPGGVRLLLASGEELAADMILVALGRTPNASGLGLESLGVALPRQGALPTDSHLRVTERILAVGDVNGRRLLAHAASHQGLYAASLIAGETMEAYDDSFLPSCIYGPVEAMRAGRSASELQADGADVKVSRALLAANPMSQAHAAPQGLVKVFWSGGVARGILAVGAGAASMSSLAAAVTAAGWRREDAAAAIFPHPGMDESVKEALLATRSPL